MSAVTRSCHSLRGWLAKVGDISGYRKMLKGLNAIVLKHVGGGGGSVFLRIQESQAL